MNTFGRIFQFTTWGESHGKAIGCVIDGVPSGIEISEAYIQKFLDARRPGSSKYVSQRKESDEVEILSGIKDGITLGSPLSAIIRNQDAKSRDYEQTTGIYRPSHADFTYHKKYGIHDWAGGGRSSARETACRVVAGAVARKVLPQDVEIKSAVVQIGEMVAGGEVDYQYAAGNALRCSNAKHFEQWEEYLLAVRKQGTSVGAKVKIIAKNVPTGLGEPVYGKLDAKIAEAMMGINAVKAVEIGEGAAVSGQFGHVHSDQMAGNEQFLSNNSGGIQGGISNGQDIEVTISIKPTSSIIKPLSSCNTDGDSVEISTPGRHDPCIGIRACPVAEAMLACVLADFHLLGNILPKRDAAKIR